VAAALEAALVAASAAGRRGDCTGPDAQGFNINQPHGMLYFSDDNAGLDARPYSLTGIESSKADYNQSRFGVNVGGPLNIPKIFNGETNGFSLAGGTGRAGVRLTMPFPRCRQATSSTAIFLRRNTMTASPSRFSTLRPDSNTN